MTAIGIWSAIVVVQNDDVPADSRIVNVEARQFAWSFSYPDEADGLQGMQMGELVVPVNEPVVLQMTSPDVIHAFWVPEWRQKQDVVPGITTLYRITPDQDSACFPMICTELCGLGHSVMRNQVTRAQRLRSSKHGGPRSRMQSTQGGGALGATVFANLGCAACHALEASGASRRRRTGPG